LLVEILNGILTFDKIEGGLMGLNATHIPVRPLVTDCVSHFEREAQRLGIRLALVVPSEEMPPYEDLEKLFGGPKGSVHRVSARRGSRSLRVNDADPLAEATVGGADGNGTGMAAVNHILGRVAAAAAQFKSLSRSDSQKSATGRKVPAHVMDPNRSPYLQVRL
jgi:signal transduction histidine kinase